MLHVLKILFCFILVRFSFLYSNQELLNQIEKNTIFSHVHWGACIIAEDDSEMLFSHNSHKLFIPASITKLFTAFAALETLRPTYQFKTTVCADNVAGGIVNGNLYLVGGGDPSLDTQRLKELARQVYERGIRQIYGNVIANDSFFLKTDLPTHGEWEDLVMDYATELSALNVNHNYIIIKISPGRNQGSLAKVVVEQDVNYCHIQNLVVTSEASTKPNITVERTFNTNQIQIQGNMPLGQPTMKIKVAIHDPKEYAKQIFIAQLKHLGIIVEGHVTENKPLGKLQEVGSTKSPQLHAIVTKMNKFSDNLYAEMLFRAMGKSPTISSMMSRVGFKTHEYNIFDGAGLTRHSLLSPFMTVKLLAYARNSASGDIFQASLPVGGIDGTLENRFKQTTFGHTILAKTGSMSGLSNLAGYAKTASGRKVIFAIFINNSTAAASTIALALDDALLLLLNSL